jgi:antitoxin (DNA-binding transcriptional repressor) of toxin-antitoxin stability system
MKVSATDLANETDAVLDKVVNFRERIEVERHGETVAVIHPREGVGRKELIQILNKLKWTAAESEELKKAMDVSEVFGYAGCD